MRTRKSRTIFGVLAVLVTGIAVTAAARQGEPSRETGPVYDMEGAWYGIAVIPGIGQVPSLDTFTSNARNPGAEGTGLCTAPATMTLPNPLNPEGWLALTASAHANWVRIGTNRYAYTAMRTIFDEGGQLAGRVLHWGTITPYSANEYRGTMNVQFYAVDGTPMYPQPFSGTLHSRRIEIAVPVE